MSDEYQTCMETAAKLAREATSLVEASRRSGEFGQIKYNTRINTLTGLAALHLALATEVRVAGPPPAAATPEPAWEPMGAWSTETLPGGNEGEFIETEEWWSEGADDTGGTFEWSGGRWQSRYPYGSSWHAGSGVYGTVGLKRWRWVKRVGR